MINITFFDILTFYFRLAIHNTSTEKLNPKL